MVLLFIYLFIYCYWRFCSGIWRSHFVLNISWERFLSILCQFREYQILCFQFELSVLFSAKLGFLEYGFYFLPWIFLSFSLIYFGFCSVEPFSHFTFYINNLWWIYLLNICSMPISETWYNIMFCFLNVFPTIYLYLRNLNPLNA